MATGAIKSYEQRRIKKSIGVIPGAGYEAWFKFGEGDPEGAAYHSEPVVCFVVARMEMRTVYEDHRTTPWRDDELLHTELRVFCYTDSAFGDDCTDEIACVLPVGATEDEVRNNCPAGRVVPLLKKVVQS